MASSIRSGAANILKQFEAKSLSAEELAQEIITSEEDHSNLNAISSFDPDLLTRMARKADETRAVGDAGPLCGLPLVVKDNINTIAYPTTGGTSALQNHTPEKNAGAITAVEAAGAIVGAKSGMHELAFGITSNNAVTGAIRNPIDPSKIPGGSSGGSAAAVAGGIFPAGLGTDTGASVRLPAALCGVVGFRPTVGRYPGDGVVPISHTRDTVGAIVNNIDDVVLLDNVLSGSVTNASAKNLSDVVLGLPKEVFFEDLEPEVEEAVQAQLKALESAGVTLMDVSLADIWAHNEAFGFPVAFYEVMRDLPAYLKEHAPSVSFEQLVEQIGSPDVAGAIGSQLGAEAMPEEAYRAAVETHGPAMKAIYEEAFKSNNLTALAFPTSPLRARDIGEDETVDLNGQQVPTFPTYIRNTDLGSNLGAPGISLPCPNVSGLPIGIEFEGVIGGDKDLIELALVAEQALNR